mmetsp:Transcript_4005/g.9485  ORF Transcript_4005/g.9485 Transcript_4005/m.9485 type:complete len:315 (-) Transcript_4005:2127-3071(-)
MHEGSRDSFLLVFSGFSHALGGLNLDFLSLFFLLVVVLWGCMDKGCWHSLLLPWLCFASSVRCSFAIELDVASILFLLFFVVIISSPSNECRRNPFDLVRTPFAHTSAKMDIDFLGCLILLFFVIRHCSVVYESSWHTLLLPWFGFASTIGGSRRCELDTFLLFFIFVIILLRRGGRMDEGCGNTDFLTRPRFAHALLGVDTNALVCILVLLGLGGCMDKGGWDSLLLACFRFAFPPLHIEFDGAGALLFLLLPCSCGRGRRYKPRGMPGLYLSPSRFVGVVLFAASRCDRDMARGLGVDLSIVRGCCSSRGRC